MILFLLSDIVALKNYYYLNLEASMNLKKVVLLLLITLLSVSLQAETKITLVLGDIDSSGKVTIADALMLAKLLNEDASITLDLKPFLDVNKDGVVDIKDALFIALKSVDKIKFSVVPVVKPVINPESTNEYYLRELEAHQNLWESRNVEAYKITQKFMCYCGGQPYTLFDVIILNEKIFRVTNTETSKVQDPTTIKGLISVSTLFKRTKEALLKGHKILKLTFNETFGYITEVSVDPNPFMADEEWAYEMKDLARLPKM